MFVEMGRQSVLTSRFPDFFPDLFLDLWILDRIFTRLNVYLTFIIARYQLFAYFLNIPT